MEKKLPNKYNLSSSVIIVSEDGKIITNCMPLNVPKELAITFEEAAEHAEHLVKSANYHDRLVDGTKELLAIVERYEPHTASCATQCDPDDFGHLGCTCEHGKITNRAKALLSEIGGE